MVIGSDNEKSEYSSSVIVKTSREPMNGEAFQKAILQDKRAEVEQMLDTPSSERLLNIINSMMTTNYSIGLTVIF